MLVLQAMRSLGEKSMGKGGVLEAPRMQLLLGRMEGKRKEKERFSGSPGRWLQLLAWGCRVRKRIQHPLSWYII